jgi:hypothetical protein
MRWHVGDLTLRRQPKPGDSTVCESCGKVGPVGEILISWGMSVNASICQSCAERENYSPLNIKQAVARKRAREDSHV